MKKIIFAVMGVALLAACKQNISAPPEEPLPENKIEAAVEEEEFEGCGFYHIDFDSCILEFIPECYLYDTITGVNLGYSSSSPENLSKIQITIDEIVIEKGVRYLFENYWGFCEEIRKKTEDSTLVIGEVEIETN